MKKRIFFTVTNDLNYDQRMIRICTSLAKAGYAVTLVGRKTRDSTALDPKIYCQHRIRVLFQKGKLFYLEFNIRLFFFLLFRKFDLVCAIDLDTILPCHAISRLQRIPRVYDAHELFCEMKEVASRPAIYKIWKRLERFSVPAFVKGYTVNGLIAGEFQKMYGVSYEVIRNLPLLEEPDSQFQQNQEEDLPPGIARGKFILYQGAVNEGRCFETLIPAMEYVDTKLVICGNGNYMSKAMDLAKQFNLEEKVIFTGYLLPAQLKAITRSAIFGINFLERSSANNYFSLANRFFDYMHACIPQVTMNYPAYREINNLYPIAVLIDETGVQSITEALNGLLSNKDLYQELQENCKQAKLIYNWQMEENKLLRFYNQILN